MNEPIHILFENREEFRQWLGDNFDKEKVMWLIYYKKHTGKTSIKQPEAVEEALCFGWIDSTVKRLDEERYMQKFTPRKPNSIWSKVNKTRCKQLIAEGKMTDRGFKLIEAAKKSGWWDKAYTNEKITEIPEDLMQALKRSKKAYENFTQFAPSHKSNYLHWINAAKRDETRQRRIVKVVERSKENKKPGML